MGTRKTVSSHIIARIDVSLFDLFVLFKLLFFNNAIHTIVHYNAYSIIATAHLNLYLNYYHCKLFEYTGWGNNFDHLKGHNTIVIIFFIGGCVKAI